jgi:transmembrane sensor
MSRVRWRTGAIVDVSLLDQAAEWHERMQGAPDAVARRSFQTWHATSNAHVQAYEHVCAAYDRAAALSNEPGLLALRQEAFARATFAPPRRPFGRPSLAAAVLLFAAAPLAAWSFQRWFPTAGPPPYEETFRTAVGQQTDVTLPDGSTVRLDTASRLHVSFTRKERRIALEGQGWFEVKPADRPFVIKAADRELTAGPGSFDVRTDPGMVRAFAGSGTLSLAAGSSSIALGDGKLLTVRGEEASIRRLEDPVTFTGWRSGMLLFDDVPLAAAVGELNRYRRQPISLADASVGTLHVSGSFRTAETPAFVDALKRGFPVRIIQKEDAGVLIAAR